MKPSEAYSIITQLLSNVNVPLKDHDVAFQAIAEIKKLVDAAENPVKVPELAKPVEAKKNNKA